MPPPPDHPLLRQRSRRQLYIIIEAVPGLRGGSLASRSGLSPKTVRHHLRRMLQAGLVQAVGERQRRYVTTRSGLGRTPEVVATLARPSVGRVYHQLRARGGMEMPHLVDSLDLAPSTVSAAVSSLRGVGLAKVHRVERRIVVVAVPLARAPAEGEAQEGSPAPMRPGQRG